MSSTTFQIGGYATGSSNPTVQITISENPDGSVTFSIVQIVEAGSYLGDLRGLFFDLSDETILGSLSVSGAQKTLADGSVVEVPLAVWASGDDSIRKVGGSSNNMNGALGSDGGYDFGIEIGSEGIGKNGDDVRAFSFTLASGTRALSLADFAGVDFGVRIMSIGTDIDGNGTIDTARNDSAKITGISPSDTENNPPIAVDDHAAAVEAGGIANGTPGVNPTGNVLTNDTDPDVGDTKTVTTVGAFVGAYGTLTLAANGSFSYALDNANLAVEALRGPADTLTDTFAYTMRDAAGTTSSATLTIAIHGANDAATITGTANGTVKEDALAGDTPSQTATGTLLVHDPDLGENVLIPQSNLAGTYGRFSVDAAGQWTYTLGDVGHIGLFLAPNTLSDGQQVTESFTVQSLDGSATETVAITVVGTNDAPTNSPGFPDAVSLSELPDGDPNEGSFVHSRSGGFWVYDPDLLDTHAISITPLGQDYRGSITASFSNPINDNTYGFLDWTFTAVDSELDSLAKDEVVEQTYRITVEDNHGADTIARTNIEPDSPNGLKNTANFQVSAVFDLILPDSPRETYGIELNDRLIGGPGTPPDQPGDDRIQLVVRQDLFGNLVVSLREVDHVADTTTLIENIALDPPAGATQVRLILSHSVSQAGTVHASFQYLDAGGSVLSAHGFGQTAQIFNGENWTRADLVAHAPAQSDSLLSGIYGTLNVNQSGAWTYNLDNSRTATQNLAKDQAASETFVVQVTDEHGASDMRTVTVNVIGTNDVPIMITGPVSRTLAEDSAPTLTETGFAQFSDIDLTDTHSYGASLQSAALSNGDPLPAGLEALLAAAMQVSEFDPATGDDHGTLQWDFALANDAVEFLAAGETLTLVYNVTVTDNHGASATQAVTIAIAGAGSGPGPVLGVVNEAGEYIPTDDRFAEQWYLKNTGQTGWGPGNLDLNVTKVWRDYTGAGVTIAVYDNGVDYTHHDLDDNYDASQHVIVNGQVSDAYWQSSSSVGGTTGFNALNAHGTIMSGIAAAENNGVGSVGVAFDAAIVGVYSPMLGQTIASSQLQQAFQQLDNFDVTLFASGGASFRDGVNSPTWGPIHTEILDAVTSGRDGLGTVILNSVHNSGPGFGNYDVNASQWDSTRFAIHVGGVTDEGVVAPNASRSAAMHVSGFTGFGGPTYRWILSTDILGPEGLGPDDYSLVGGTTSAVSQIAGVAALILQANPNLGWRDVQSILVDSARHTGSAIGGPPNTLATETDAWEFNGSGDWNGGGRHYSIDYGYGIVDALAAVRMAETWHVGAVAQTSQNEATASGGFSSNAAIPNGTGTSIVQQITIAQNISIESAELRLAFSHGRPGDLNITLTSPDGTFSTIFHPMDGTMPNVTGGWRFVSQEFRGELSAGTWTLTITDTVANGASGSLSGNVGLFLFGSADTVNNRYVFTDEYADYAALPGRNVLTDANGGIDTINAAAVTSASVIDLNAGAVSTIAGHSLTIAAGTEIENAIGGDGNDILIGNGLDNVLFGGRGNDTMTGDAGNDTFVFNRPGDGVDTVTDFTQGEDVFQVSAADFGGGLVANTAPTLLAGAPAGASNAGSGGYFIFDDGDGTLYWDATGGAGTDAVAIATLLGVSSLLPSDFHVV